MAMPIEEINRRIAKAEKDIEELTLIISQIESGGMQEGFRTLNQNKNDRERAEKRLSDLRERKDRGSDA